MRHWENKMNVNLIRDIVTTCQNCNKKFMKTDRASVKLHVYLDTAFRESLFCSTKCYETKVSNINKGAGNNDLKIKIKSTEVVREHPLFIRMITEVEMFKVII